ncbi:uncharacterized protein LOC114250647 [Bombyx mandarina]|uniref:Uncharacterized protein LOC114250647 n=1 Tax=Bombyx mandarina TaxID=7092 RepID=A0A6J2KDL3_BOMMA|nr:uncharacterized protein LOC114250647 [Bombyx mandarina]
MVKLNSQKEMQRFIAELNSRDPSSWSATNPHFAQPNVYKDLGRRFVPQYPYTEATPELLLSLAKQASLWTSSDLNNAYNKPRHNQKNILRSGNYWDGFWKEDTDPKILLRSNDKLEMVNKEEEIADDLTPQLASPEIVLALAKQAAILEASKPVNPSEDIVQKNILRSGNYWNDFWKEDVSDGTNILRSNKKINLKTIKIKITPEDDEYEAIMKLKKISPYLIYAVNNKKTY